MSADVIQAKYDDLDAIASRFGSQAAVVAELQAAVKRNMAALENKGWEGKGAAAFFAEMHTELLPALQRLRQVLDEGRAVTLEAKTIIERAEQEAAALFQASGNGVAGQQISNLSTSEQAGKPAAAPESGPSVMDVIHGALDVAGFVPGFGAIPDAINAGIYIVEGDWGNAAMSGIAAVPIIGDAAKAVDKVHDAVKAVDKVHDAVKAVDKVDDAVDAAKTIERVDDAKAAAKLADGLKQQAKHLDDLDEGHSIARHGPDVPDSALKDRITTGIAPDKKVSPTQTSTRFRSYDDWLRTRQAALDEIAKREGVDFTQPPAAGKPSRYQTTTDHGNPPIGDGFKGVDVHDVPHPNKPGTSIPVYRDTESINNIQRTRTTVVWDAAKGRWVVKQHFPLP